MSKPIEQTLYCGDVNLTRGANHVYRVRVEGGKSYPVKNVTSIIGMKDKSRALLPWQAKVIEHVVGKSVEQLIGSLPEPGITFKFTENAYSRMVAGLNELKRKCLTATNDIRDAAADEGAMIHDYVEAFFKARMEGKKTAPRLPKLLSPPARRAIKAFAQWVVDNDVECIACERLVFSRTHFYVGQMDLLLKVNGVVAPWDVKGGKSIYDSVLMQLAAYRNAWNEEADVDDTMPQATGDGGVLLFQREDISPVEKTMTGDFYPIHLPEGCLADAADTFEALQRVSKWDRDAWKLCKDAVDKARGL